MVGMRSLHFSVFCRDLRLQGQSRAEIMFFWMLLLGCFKKHPALDEVVSLSGWGHIFLWLEHPKRREINSHHRIGTLCLEEIFGLWKAMFPGNHFEVSLADALAVAQKSGSLLHSMAEQTWGSSTHSNSMDPAQRVDPYVPHEESSSYGLLTLWTQQYQDVLKIVFLTTNHKMIRHNKRLQ
jgi:hypothetical protein